MSSAGQIDITKEVLNAMGITVLAEAGYEADDIIATLATPGRRGRLPGAGGHRRPRLLQLVNANVTVLYPIKGVSTLTRYTPDAVQEKYGLTPCAYLDSAALRGDPSDNLPASRGGVIRRQVDRRIRLAAGPGRQRRHRPGQGRRFVARQPLHRDPRRRTDPTKCADVPLAQTRSSLRGPFWGPKVGLKEKIPLKINYFIH